MKVYNVYHTYNTAECVEDNEYGGDFRSVSVDAETELVASFTSEINAKAFVDKYSKPYIYFELESWEIQLYCNKYIIKETEVITDTEFDISKTPEDYGIHMPTDDDIVYIGDSYDDDEEVKAK